MAKSSNFFPSLIAATSQRGLAPLPAHVLPDLSRYFGGTFFPLSDPPRPLLDAISPPNLASWLRSTTVLRLSSFPTSSRNCKSCSTDIEPRFVLGIGYLPTKKAPYNIQRSRHLRVPHHRPAAGVGRRGRCHPYATSPSEKRPGTWGWGLNENARFAPGGWGVPGHGPRVLLSLLAHDAIVRRDCTELVTSCA